MSRRSGPNGNIGDNGDRINANRNGINDNNRGRRGRRGGGRGGGRGRGNHRQGDAGGSRNHINTTPRLSIFEIKQSQEETTIANFSSSALTFKGSDGIVFITDGDSIKSIWKKVLRKSTPWNQNDVRFFVSSALVATDSQTGYIVEDLVKELGNPDSGIKRFRDIINFPLMSCDAGLKSNVLSFQHVILPLLGLLTRTAITDCNLEKYIIAIYMVVYTNIDSFLYDKVMKMLETLVQRQSVKDREISVEELLRRERYSFIPSSLGIFFLVIVRLLIVLLCRIKEASINETMHKISYELQQLKDTYQQMVECPIISSDPDPIANNLETKKYFFAVLDKEIKTMCKMLNNGNNDLILEGSNSKDSSSRSTLSRYKELARRVDLKRMYDPPGELSKEGIRRHDNDLVEISKISILPTREEILCDRQPFLPSTLPDSPHFLSDGAARLLDTQFRLLREDMLNPIRGGISNFLTALLKDWTSPNNNNKLSGELRNIQERGGRFKYNNGLNDNGDLQVYTNIQFVRMDCDRRNGFYCILRFNPPRFRNTKDHWEKSKKLLNGNMVALLIPNPESKQSFNSYNNKYNSSISKSDLYSIYFGVVSSRDVFALADHSEIGIRFIDASIYPIALNEISHFHSITQNSLEKRFLVESTGVYFEAYYHILKTLQKTDPNTLPFEKYLAPEMNKNENENRNSIMDVMSRVLQKFSGSNNIMDVKVEIPLYARAPGFCFDLSVLCKPNHGVNLKVSETGTYDEIADYLSKNSEIGKSNGTPYGLDETQAKALISALTREIALIEGPPGTGKTVVGIQLMKVLLAKKNRKEKFGPILTICFTNHALDQFLEHLLDENIKSIVRLGSRSKSERVRELGLDKISCHSEDAYLLRTSLREVEDQMNKMAKTFFKRWMAWNDIKEYLENNEKRFYKKFNYVTYNDLPRWVLGNGDKSDPDGYETVQNRRNKKLSTFEKWVKGEDFMVICRRKEFLSNLLDNRKKDKTGSNMNTYELLKDTEMNSDDEDDDDESLFDHEEIGWIKNYKEPTTNRSLDELLRDNKIWKMSRIERQKLHDHWRATIYSGFEKNFAYLQKKYERERNEIDKVYDQERIRTLKNCDVIGMTTNGAAKFQNLIRSIRPKIIICEEAGEVLEAHILSALTEDTQHLILIGDHNQLRPGIATYSLSMDSSTGQNYQLDKSLFERLVQGDRAIKIEKSQLLTQRRMRKKEISDLIRYTLYSNEDSNTPVYSKLTDGDNTAIYPNIRGAQHNVYFIDHRHPEDSSADSALQSHSNRYEVEMVVEMVKYFVRNGYTKPDDIAVLTPYLGQMIKIREALAKSFVVVIDERDAQNIAEMEEQGEDRENGESGENKEKEKENVIEENVGVASTKPLNRQVTLRTVDNFQGEEANIVIISLVRNFSKFHQRDTIGFLKSSNRSNVLLSRAREGMYLIGNSELMSSRSDMWNRVIKILRERNPPQVGFGMPIVCNRHPDYKNIVTEPDQFEQFSPDGGCFEKCDIPLPCGHACTFKCHSDDPKHIKVQCEKPCTKLHSECNHPCPKSCFEDCEKCEFSIGDITLPGCGHTFKDAKCWQEKNKEKIKCIVPIDVTLPCDHISHNVSCWKNEIKDTLKCNFIIGDITLPNCSHIVRNATCSQNQNIEKFRCMELVTRKLSTCEHYRNVYCSDPVDNVRCNERCRKKLECGHECLNNCYVCQASSTSRRRGETRTDTIIERTQHGKCIGICNKLLFCGHSCKKQCHEGKECKLCNNKCSISCEHSKCKKDCLDPCAVCAKRCLWECIHQGKCVLSCGVPCSRLPCNERCDKTLRCGHRCAGICGEICPSKDFCVECSPEKVKNQVPDRINDTIFIEVDWNEERMVVLSCGHVFTMKTMDMLMEMEDYYECSFEGRWTSVKPLPNLPAEIKMCPECLTPIKDIKRYGRIIKKCTLDLQNKKFLLKYDHKLKDISQKIYRASSKLRIMRDELMSDIPKLRSISREKIFKDYNKILNNEVIPYYYFENIEVYHGFDEDSEQVWIYYVDELLKYYQKLTSIIRATNMPPYKKAFDAAVSYAKENSEDDLVLNLSNLRISDSSSSNPILQILRLNSISRRVYLDAFLEIINIQKILYHEVLFIIEEVSNRSNFWSDEDDEQLPFVYDGINIKEVWKSFAERLQYSIQRHLYKISEEAQSAHFGRHLLLVNIEILEFDLKILTYQLRYPHNGNFIDKALQTRILTKCKEIKKSITEMTKNYEDNNYETDDSNIYKRIKKLNKYCKDVMDHAEKFESTLEDLEKLEKLEIHSSVKTGFDTSGLWNECPKGHPYTNEECCKTLSIECPDCSSEGIINNM